MNKAIEMGLILMFGIFLVGGLIHETIHVQIYESYGIKSHIEYFSHFPSAVTIADSPCPTDSCTLANNINEIVGYTASGFLAVLGILLIYFRTSMEEKK